MRLWSVCFVISCMVGVAVLQDQNVRKRTIQDPMLTSNEILTTKSSSSSGNGRGLWNRFSGIFQKISQYFGFTKAENRKIQESPVVRRPEMLPFQLQYPKNRRSGQAPNIYADQYDQFPDSSYRAPSKKQRLLMERNQLAISNKLIPPSATKADESDSTQNLYRGPQDSVVKPDHRTPTNQEKTSFMIVHVKDDKQDPSKPATKPLNYNQPSLSVAKVVSREPLVSVYNKGVPTTKKSPPKAIAKVKNTSPVHSKFSMNNYSFSKDPVITSNKQSNSFVVTSSITHGKAEVPTAKNNPLSGGGTNFQNRPSSTQDRMTNTQDQKMFTQSRHPNNQDRNPNLQSRQPNSKDRYSNSQDRNLYSQDKYQISQNVVPTTENRYPSLVRKERTRNYYEREQEQDLKPFFASPPAGAEPQPKTSERRKGLIVSMTNFASNLFSNFLPKSQSSEPALKSSLSVPPLQQLQAQQSNQFQFVEKRSPAVNSQQSKFTPPNMSRFAPSPLQGSMKVDSFQPIFVPSPSLDSKLNPDAMKPMILPQPTKKIQATPSPPQLLDFF